ncbi:MAG: patatin-like phospholipase family protein [Burkholderiales bacterium]|nr:patatin-like phospholipase family protein [Burkholderiales bacterium]
MKALEIRAGKTALAHIRAHGLQAQDIAVLPAAAGGPKGLILQALDQWLFGEWLPAAPRVRTLIGASIGAWRMAAASHADPAAAFRRLGDLYCAQTYTARPGPQEVTSIIKQLLQEFIGGHEQEIAHQPLHRLQVLAMRGRGWLAAPGSRLGTRAGFAAAGLANLASRARLARHMDRMVIGDLRDPLYWLKAKFDNFDTHFSSLTPDNLASALLASGTLPLIMQPVTRIAHAPNGQYWDGGMIDYHLALPYSRLTAGEEGALVLYPHFTDHIVPGWLDKPLPWRRAGRGENRDWLDNVIMLSPSADFVRSLPRSKLPDRKDFSHYGLQHDLRARNWKIAIAESERLRDEFAAFADNPDPARILPF